VVSDKFCWRDVLPNGLSSAIMVGALVITDKDESDASPTDSIFSPAPSGI
jgi:hypothetical protein